jgi:anti-sigma-K factor RskA
VRELRADHDETGTTGAGRAGWENYMRDLADAAQSAPLTPEVMARIASRYDFEFTE